MNASLLETAQQLLHNLLEQEECNILVNHYHFSEYISANKVRFHFFKNQIEITSHLNTFIHADNIYDNFDFFYGDNNISSILFNEKKIHPGYTAVVCELINEEHNNPTFTILINNTDHMDSFIFKDNILITLDGEVQVQEDKEFSNTTPIFQAQASAISFFETSLKKDRSFFEINLYRFIKILY